MPLFFNCFSIKIRFIVRKYSRYIYIINRFVNGVESCFDYSFLLQHNHRPISGFRGYGTKMLLRKNILLSFKNIEYKEICVPSLSGLKRNTQNAKRIYRAYIISYYSHASRIILYIILNSYKVWRSSRNFYEQPRACFCSALSCHLIVPIPISITAEL